MPWTPKDAAAKNSRVKGSPKLQKLWADTANGTLASELKKGTPQSKAEGIAIATANKAVKKKPAKPVSVKTAARTVTKPAAVLRSADLDLRMRLSPIAPASMDEERHTVRAVLATEDACISRDMKTGKGFLEVYLMAGMEPVEQVPLCDVHHRDSIDRIKGSVRAIAVNGDQVVGDLCLSDAEFSAWSKVRERHITDVSAGFEPLETTEIKAGQSKSVGGRSYTAPADRPLFVHTRWRLREVSLTPIGADSRAKIRTAGDPKMDQKLRKWLQENLSERLRADATEEEAQTLWDSLPAEERARAEESCREKDDPDEDDDEEEDDDEDGDGKQSFRRVKRTSTVTEETRAAEESERIRTATAAGIQTERQRMARIKKAAGDDVPAEIVTRALDEGWTVARAKSAFLAAIRQSRSPSVGGGGDVASIEATRSLFGGSASGGPAIQSHSRERDCTVASMSAALLASQYTGGQDLMNILGGYQPTRSMIDEESGKPETGQCHVVRSDVTQMICGRTRQAGDNHRKTAERILEMGDRYRSMLPMDMVDECNRIEGRHRTSWDREERVRAAMSGSALAAIFTQNVSAQFLGGYLDAEDTTRGWVTESDVPNFLTNERAIFGKMGQLQRLGKGGTAEDLNTSDWNETYKIYRYAGKFIVDEQDLINDRFGAIEQMAPQDMGLTARNIRPNLVYANLLSNPTLNQDSAALFNATATTTAGGHANLGTGAITDFSATTPTANAGPIQDATSAMAKQRLRSRPLNLKPRYIIAGHDLSRALNFLYAPANTALKAIVSASGYSYNPTVPELNDINLVYDSRLDPLGCYNNLDKKTYYPWVTSSRSLTCILAARPGEQGAKTFEVGYRTGTGRAPRIRSSILREGSGQYGFSWDVNLDIGVLPLDFRGLYLITGGGSQASAG